MLQTNLKGKDKLNTRVYFPEIDGLRFFAFLLVFIHHSLPHNNIILNKINAYGWIGVDLFFLLSAFLLTKLMLKEREKSGSINFRFFYIRRLLRIWPLYFAYVVYILSTFYLLFNSQAFANVNIRVLGLFTFTDNIFSMFLNYNHLPGSVHLWTISFEEQFYIVLPFLLPFLIKNRKYATIFFISVILLVFGLRYLFISYTYPFIYVSPLHIDSFLFGIILGLGLTDELMGRIPQIIKVIVGFSCIIFITYLPNRIGTHVSLIFTYFIIAVGFSFLLDSVSRADNLFVTFFFKSGIVRYLGKISYGLYIFHLIIIAYTSILFNKLGISPNWISLFIASLILTILVSAISYEFYEKYFLKLKEKYTIIKSRPA